MKIKPFFPVFVVLVGVVIYAYHTMDKKPRGAVTATPKQYIEMVEQNKTERMERQKESRAAEEQSSR